MSTRPLPLLAVLTLLVLAALWLWRSGSAAQWAEFPALAGVEHADGQRTGLNVGAAAPSPASDVASSHTSEASRSAVEDARSGELVAPPDDRLTGEVRDVHGQPLPGARVEVRRRASAGTSSLDLVYNRVLHPVGTGETDDRGHFSLSVPEHRPLEVRIRAAGHATAMFDGVFGGEHLVVDLVAGAVLEGRITSKSTGLGMAGVHLRGFAVGAKDLLAGDTDGSGGFRFAGLPPGPLTLAVEPDVLAAPGWKAVVLEAAAVVRIDFTLEDGIAIRGQVTDGQSGEPIVGAVIGAGWTFDRPVTTDRDGRYVLPGFGGPGVYDIHARAAGHGKAQHEFEPGAMPTEDVELDFVLPPARAAIGRVVGADGTGVEGVYVAAVASTFAKRVQRTDWDATRTSADGRFRLSSLTPDLRHQLLVRPDGLAVLIYDFPPDEESHAVLDLGTIELVSAARLVGVVVDERDQPRPDLPVLLEGRGADVGRYGAEAAERLSISYTNTRESRTDRRGRFHFADLAPGTYELRVRVPESTREVTLQATVTVGQALDDLVLVVPIGLAIRGHVVDPDGQPCRQVMVRLPEVSLPRGVSTVTTDAEGAFEITGLDPGRYTLRADTLWFNFDEDDERELYDTTLEGVQAGTTDLRIVLRAIAAITGSVLTADGSVPLNMAVEAYDPLSRKKLAHDRLDSEGRFRLALPAGVIVDLETRAIVPQENGGYSIQEPDERTARRLGIEAGTQGLALRLGE